MTGAAADTMTVGNPVAAVAVHTFVAAAACTFAAAVAACTFVAAVDNGAEDIGWAGVVVAAAVVVSWAGISVGIVVAAFRVPAAAVADRRIAAATAGAAAWYEGGARGRAVATAAWRWRC